MELDGAQLAEALRGKQVPLLLAYMVLNRGRHLGRDELIDALWPDGAPANQDASLRTLLSRLRSALGADTVVGRDELQLRLPEPAWIDVEAARTEVEHSVTALGSGDVRAAWALAQVPLNIASRGLLPGSQARWLEPCRRELEDLRLRALEVIGRAGLQLGGTQLASVERAARTLIEAEPYRESGYVLLMEALAAEGNVAEAVRVFDRLRRLLREELGTTPSPDAIELHGRLLRPTQRAERRARGGRARQPVAIELPAELRARATGTLVGRVAELEQIERRWAYVRSDPPPAPGRAPIPGSDDDGTERLLLLTGDPGIGKTRLVAEVARRAHDAGAVVLAGRAPEETLVPYQPFLDALRHYVLNAAFGELRMSAREYGSELARLVPELRRRVPDLPPPPTGEPETERYRLFESVIGLLTEISAATPVLLVLDDLHSADRPTLLLLRHLARAPGRARVLILGTYRSSEAMNGPLVEALSELRHERLVSEITIDGLTEAETAELILGRSGLAPAPGFVRWLHSETEGNPFFIEEIVRQLIHGGVEPDTTGARELSGFGLPEGVKRVIARRMSGLRDPALELLRTAATIGRDFDASLLERVVTLNEDEFLDALDEALAAGVVVQAPGAPDRYSFSHALIRETLYDAMSEPRRARLHRRVGETIEALGEEQNLAVLARHFERAAGPHEVERAVRYARRAGENATALLAYEEAVDHYSRALSVLERYEPDWLEHRCELLLELGEARVRGGERAHGRKAFLEAAELATRLGDWASLARAAVGASGRYVLQPGVVDEELITLLERALAATPEWTTLRVRLLARLCGELYFSSDSERMSELAAEATAIAGELDDPEARAYAAAARRRALWHPSHLPQRLQASTEMLTFGLQTPDLEMAQWGHAWLVVDLLEQGDRDAVDAQIAAFIAGADELRQPLYVWNAIVWRAMRALLAGDLKQAEQLAGEALAIGAQAESVTAPQYYAIQLLAIRREQGRMAELEPAARELTDRFPARPAWRAALATLLYETGRVEEAARELETLAASDFRDIPADGDWIVAITLLSDLCSDLGDRRRAEQVYELLLPFAEVNVVIGLAVVCLGSAGRFLGRLAAAMGDRERAVEHFERALAANIAMNAPVCLARTQLDYAAAIGAGSRASELIQAAERTAERLRLPALASRAATLKHT